MRLRAHINRFGDSTKHPISRLNLLRRSQLRLDKEHSIPLDTVSFHLASLRESRLKQELLNAFQAVFQPSEC
jgi:hypothetical protein